MAILPANYIWRKYNIDGVAESGFHQPDGADIRPWGTEIERTAGYFSSIADLQNRASPQSDRLYIVAFDGFYKAYRWVPGSTEPVDSAKNTVVNSNTASGRYIEAEGVPPIYVLVMGQSNAVGADPATDGSFFNANSRVQVWKESTAEWVTPTVSQEPFNVSGSFNAGLAFCNRLATETGRQIRMVLVADGSRPIADWTGSAADRTISVGNRPKYVELQTAMTAIGALMDVFIWIQGEADDAAGIAYYSNEFKFLMGAMTSDGYVGNFTPVVASQLSMGSTQQAQGTSQNAVWSNANVYSLLHNGDRRVRLANSYGVATSPEPTVDAGSHVHFSDAGLDELGRNRIYAAYKMALDGYQHPVDFGIERMRMDVGLIMNHMYSPKLVTAAESPYVLPPGEFGGLIKVEDGATVTLPDFTDDVWTSAMAAFSGWQVAFMLTQAGSFTLAINNGTTGTGVIQGIGALNSAGVTSLLIDPVDPSYTGTLYRAMWGDGRWRVWQMSA